MFPAGPYVSIKPLSGIPNFPQSAVNSDWVMTFLSSASSKTHPQIFLFEKVQRLFPKRLPVEIVVR